MAPRPVSRLAQRVVRILLAVAAGLAIGVTAYLVPHRGGAAGVPNPSDLGDRTELFPVVARVADGTHISLTDTLHGITETVRISQADTGRSIDLTPITCHGGRARVVWHVGNLEPTAPTTGIVLTARFDGVPIGSLLRGSTNGTYNDTPVSIQALVDCPIGDHVVDLVLTRVEGSWGIPYVQNVGQPPAVDFSINRGFIVEEIY